MNTNEMTGEKISAFTDGECTAHDVEMALAALRQSEGKAAWDIYHQIGDVLRSDDMAVSLSPGFSSRMAARLELEPTIVAPTSQHKGEAESVHFDSRPDTTARRIRRWALPGAVAAVAAAAAAFVATPQLMVALNGEVRSSDAPTVSGKVVSAFPNTEQGAVIAASASEGVVLRDPRIDDYLLAHQRFSPSVFSSAQYARSATFASGSNK